MQTPRSGELEFFQDYSRDVAKMGGILSDGLQFAKMQFSNVVSALPDPKMQRDVSDKSKLS